MGVVDVSTAEVVEVVVNALAPSSFSTRRIAISALAAFFTFSQ
jgi:hypothetical protein